MAAGDVAHCRISIFPKARPPTAVENRPLVAPGNRRLCPFGTLSMSDTAFSSGPDLSSWVPPRPGIDHSVAIIGGGQNGSAFAFALRRAGIGGATIIDAALDESQAGVWLTRARMRRLRTPKSIAGPELGFPDLSFQTWYESHFGGAAYDVFDRVSRTDWAEYLKWYRTILGIPIRYGVHLTRIEPAEDHFRLHLTVGGTSAVETARKVILANGVAGSGGPFVPPQLAALPKSHAAHTADPIDFDALNGKTVAVVGGAASAFDAAAVALESGAAAVHLFVRRAVIASLPVYRNRFYAGAFENYFHLPDAVRWRQALRGRDSGSTPPAESIDRVTRFPNFHLHLTSPWDSADVRDGKIAVRVRDESFVFDFVIAGTGYATDLGLRPELQEVLPHIRLWRDQYTPPPGEEDTEIGLHPYLGQAHEFLEKQPGAAPFLKNIHVYNPGGYVSFGLPTGDLWTMRRDLPIIVKRIGQDLFLADLDHHEARLSAPVAPEFGVERYASAIWHGGPAIVAPTVPPTVSEAPVKPAKSPAPRAPGKANGLGYADGVPPPSE